MSQKGLSAVAILIVAIILAAGVGGYLVLTKRQPQQEEFKPAETVQPAPTAKAQVSIKVVSQSQIRRGDVGTVPLVPKVFKKIQSFLESLLREAMAEEEGLSNKYLVYHNNLGTPAVNRNVQLFLYSFSTKEAKKLTSSGYNSNPVFSPDGTKVLFYGGKPDVIRKLQIIDLATSEVKTVVQQISVFSAFSFSPDGSTIAYEILPKSTVEPVGFFANRALAQEGPVATIALVDASSLLLKQTYKIPLPQSALIAKVGQSVVNDIVWSPDGKSLFVNLETGGNFPKNFNGIFKLDLESGNHSLLEESGYEKKSLGLTPDGHFLSYFRSSVSVNGPAGGAKTLFVLFDPQTSQEIKTFEVFDSAAFLAWPYLWSPDQQKVYIGHSAEGKLVSLDLSTSQVKIIKSSPFLSLIGWGPAPNTLIFADVPEQSTGGIYSLDLSTGSQEKLVDVTSE